MILIKNKIKNKIKNENGLTAGQVKKYLETSKKTYSMPYYACEVIVWLSWQEISRNGYRSPIASTSEDYVRLWLKGRRDLKLEDGKKKIRRRDGKYYLSRKNGYIVIKEGKLVEFSLN